VPPWGAAGILQTVRYSSPEHLEAEVQLACQTPGGPVAVERAVAGRLQAAVPFDAWCTLTIDPASVLPTGGFHEQGVPAALLPQLVQIEARTDDALALPTLVRHPGRTATLSTATHGQLDRSQRYREILRPSGLEHELRLLYRSDANLWGTLILFRGVDAPDFSPSEADLLERATSGVAAAIRREMVLTEIAHPHDADGPGLLLLSTELDPQHITPTAQRWLTAIEDGVDPGRELPYAVVTLATRALGGARSKGSLRSRIRARSGQWLTLHAELLPGDPPQVSIIVEPSRPVEIAQLVADAYQLTARERDVVRLLACGYSRHEIARLLALSPHTVDDHIKRVFGKLQVRSRSELTYRLFFDQHAPRIYSEVPIGGSGWFLR
jgi:DNA-binding CsgD family transcriptional regulator